MATHNAFLPPPAAVLAMKDCASEYGLAESTIFTNLVPKSKICVYKCVAEKLGVMDVNGQFTLDTFKAKFPDAPEKLLETQNKCATIVKTSTPCATGKDFHDCMIKNLNRN